MQIEAGNLVEALKMDWFHAEARISIDRHARDLATLVRDKFLDINPSAEAFVPDWPAAASLTQEDVVGGIEGWSMGSDGSIAERTFTMRGRTIVLDKSGCIRLDRLLDLVLKNPAVHASVTEGLLIPEILEWLWLDRNEKEAAVRQLSERLESAISSSVREYQVSIPIAGLSIETEIPFGRATLVPLDRERVDLWLKELSASRPDSEVPGSERYRKELQGLAAVQVVVRGTAAAAMKQASEVAALVAAVIRVFHPASSSYLKRIVCAPLGLEYQPSEIGYLKLEGRPLGRSSRILATDPGFVTLTSVVMGELSKVGFAEACDIVNSDSRTNFQERLLRAAIVFSRVSTEYAQSDRLVFLLSALETILLRNESEPIQQNLGERLAFFIMNDPAERMRIVRLVKEAYRLRSRYLHHGLERASLEEVNDLFLYAWLFFQRAIRFHAAWNSAEEFFLHLDEKKFR